MKRLLALCIATLLTIGGWFAAPAQATGVYDLPVLSAEDTTFIIDDADVLSPINETKLVTELEQVFEKTGTKVRFVTLRHFNYGETATSFTNSLFEKWFPTPEAEANEVLVVLDTVTNDAAIRVGNGAKSELDDSIADSVVKDTLGFFLRQGDKYNQAFLAVEERLATVLSGQEDPGAPQVAETTTFESNFATAEETESERNNYVTIVAVLLIAATVIPMATYFIFYT